MTHATRLFLRGLVVIALLAPGICRSAVRLVPEQFPAIQGAIDQSLPGDTVLVGPGVYRGAGNREITFGGKDVVLLSRNGPDATVIDCERQGRGFYLLGHETTAARIEGITVRNGLADSGGGIKIDASSPMIVNCKILDCEALMGGGMVLGLFHGELRDCVIAGNYASLTQGGGGILGWWADGPIINCVITGNWAYYGGGLSFASNAPYHLTNCTITGNFATYGGGIQATENTILERCIIRGNCAVLEGADLYSAQDARLICCVADESGLHGANCEDCIFEDPRFCGPVPCGQTTGGDWTLQGDSPCLPENNSCGLVGALGQGCGGGPTAVERASWGRIKARYLQFRPPTGTNADQ